MSEPSLEPPDAYWDMGSEGDEDKEIEEKILEDWPKLNDLYTPEYLIRDPKE